MRTIWHDLRSKPKIYEDVLVVTTSKKKRFRICYYTHYGTWVDSISGYSFVPKSVKGYKPKPKNPFIIKKWAYLEDIEKL